ncbi:MAG TPA: hypothetical protein VGX45_07760, partial [Solirubrobacteraceae bacterium]|nr:hypothetical protein [Solirubrobacteraceae bacterium]
MSARAEHPIAVQTPLERLADELLARVEAIVERAAERMQETLPSYSRIPRAELLPVLRANMRNILLAVSDPEAAPRDDDAHYRETGEIRA